MRIAVIFSLAFLGILAGIVGAVLMGQERVAEAPLVPPISSPLANAIYANGIVESDQGSGSNISIYPFVAGQVTHVQVHEGQAVKAGAALFTIDDAIQGETAKQFGFQVDAAQAALDELRAQPRPEVLRVSERQLEEAKASLTLAQRQYEKRRAAYKVNPAVISQDEIDTAEDQARQAEANVRVAEDQYALTKAGAWSYDVRNQEQQLLSLQHAHQSALELLGKYTVAAQVDGEVVAINASVGSYVSPQGILDPYTEGMVPAVVMATPQSFLDVRCYVDEILIPRLPPAERMVASMQIRGTVEIVPLEFVRIQPLVSPKIELSNQREERVDLRVLPVIFRFQVNGRHVYPGQLVDVFIGQR